MGSAKVGPAPSISSLEVCKALKTMANHKAGGTSGVVAEMFKASGDAGKADLLCTLFNQIIQERTIPLDWEKSIINLYKGGCFRSRELSWFKTS